MHRSLTANVGELPEGQSVKAQKMIKQTKVWLNEVRN